MNYYLLVLFISNQKTALLCGFLLLSVSNCQYLQASRCNNKRQISVKLRALGMVSIRSGQNVVELISRYGVGGLDCMGVDLRGCGRVSMT